MSYYNWQHQFLRRFLPLTFHGLTGLYLSNALRDIGLAMVSVFVPIYLYKTLGSISAVFIFLALYHAIILLSTYPIARIISRIGLDNSGLIGGLLHSVFFGLLIAGKNHPQWLWMAAVAWGLSIPFTWLTHHYYLVSSSGRVTAFGSKLALMCLWDRWLLTIVPLIGGILLDLGGFELSYGIAIFFWGISGLPLFFDAFDRRRIALDLQDTYFGLFDRSQFRISLALFFAGMKDEAVITVWAIYLFTVVKNYTKIGIIQTGSLFIASLLLFWIGKQVDRKNKKMLRPALLVNTVNVLSRGIIQGGLGLFFIESLYQLAGLFIWIPFDARVYETAIKKRRMEFFIRREWLLHSGGLIGCLVLAIVFSMGIPWYAVFVFGAATLLAVGLIKL